jgi:hypothetical protein
MYAFFQPRKEACQMKLKIRHHGNEAVRIITQDDSASEILEDFEQQSPMPGSTRQDTRRRKLIGSLPVSRFQIERDSVLWRIWDGSPDDEPATGMGPGGALAVALRGASHDAASRTQDADDRLAAADASLPMPQRLAALGRINSRHRHDLR